MVQIDLGRNGQAWRYFSGYVERDQPADNGSRRLFIREAAGILDFDFPCSLQHPTLRDVLNNLSHQSGIVFITADADYTTTPVPYATHSGSGTQLLNQLGRTFSIPDYVWHPMPDGSVFVGSAADSRFASLSLPDIPPEYALGSSAGNSMDIMLIETIRPGVNLPAGRITRVAVHDEQMTLTWERLDGNGKPLSCSPLRRQIENQFPELVVEPCRPVSPALLPPRSRPRSVIFPTPSGHAMPSICSCWMKTAMTKATRRYGQPSLCRFPWPAARQAVLPILPPVPWWKYPTSKADRISPLFAR
ncbi:hypothetical protein ACXZFE_000355 [Escherichia coli]